MLNIRAVFYLFFTYFSEFTESARILAIFPAEYRSHFNFNNAIMKTLQSAGHQITSITPFLSDTILENYINIDPKVQHSIVSNFTVEEMSRLDLYSFLRWSAGNDISYCEAVMKLDEIQVGCYLPYVMMPRMITNGRLVTSTNYPLTICASPAELPG